MATGIVLFAAVAAALVLRNSPLAPAFEWLWSGPLHHAVNHGLMTLFFLLVGLEMKREVVAGELGTRRGALLPLAAAVGGVVAPVALYLAVAGGEHARGWGVPASTDTAFALAVLGLLGRRAAPSLRLFLTAFAVIDDVAAVAIIAAFYSTGVSAAALLAAGAGLALLAAANALGVRRIAVYLAVGALVWAAMARSGVHATLAGILVALTVPRVPLARLEHGLAPWVHWAVLPLLALCNAGVPLGGGAFAVLAHPAALGVALGLAVGKPLGVLAASALAVKLLGAELPRGTGWRQIAGAAALAGIGFTMSIFIATVAFGDEESLTLDEAKLAVLVGSLAAGLAGVALSAPRPGALRASPPRSRRTRAALPPSAPATPS